jgi:hypothetical protein
MILAPGTVEWFADHGFRRKPFVCRSCMTFWLSLIITFSGLIWKGDYNYAAFLNGRLIQYGVFVHGLVFSFAAFLVTYFSHKDD